MPLAMFSVLNSGTWLKRLGYTVAIIDLILANVAVVLGFTTLHFAHTPGWHSHCLQILQLPVTFLIPETSSHNFLLLFSLCTFFVESCLSVLLIHAVRKLDRNWIRVWFRIRLLFFILTFVSLVIRTVELRNVSNSVTILEQGSLGILYMVYRGYGLIVTTFLEELAYKRVMGVTYQLL